MIQRPTIVHDEDAPRRGLPRWLRWLGTAAAGGAGVFVALYFFFTSGLDSEIDLTRFNRIPSMTITDENGTIVASRGSAYGEHVRLGEMPAHLKAAFIAAEDRRFYGHFGIDLWGLSRAMIANIRAGSLYQGGSTITQQLARSLFLSNERTLGRKVEEMFLALWLELHLSKDEILELYLNRIYLGSGAYGVDAAARRYFGLSARDVNLSQAAMLAAMTRAPGRFAPTSDIISARDRTSGVLDAMVETGVVSEGEAFAARVIPAGPGTSIAGKSVNYYVDYVLNELTALGIDTSADLIVKTTIDAELQGHAQEAIANALATTGADKGVSQAACIVMTPQGAVRAVVGGRDYFESPFNRAFQAKRQPGSAFKMFVYLAAMEAGLTPGTMRIDEPINIGGWQPDNYGESYRGPVTLYEGLSKSINTIAAQLGQEIGIDHVIEAAKRLGIATDLQYVRSLALGTSEVTLAEMTSAFATLANNGLAVTRHAVLEVKRPDGEVLYVYQEPAPNQLVAERILREMNFMLAGVIREGTGRGASLGGRPAAGKTGTTQDHHDAWFIGYTADFAGGVWAGNDDNTPMDKVVGGTLPATLWREIMTAAHAGVAAHELAGTNDTFYADENPYEYFEDGRGYADRDRLDERERRGRGDWYDGPPPPPYEDEEDILDFLFGGPPEPPPPPPDWQRYRRN